MWDGTFKIIKGNINNRGCGTINEIENRKGIKD